MTKLSDISTGQVFETGRYLMTREKTVAFASEFDPQPMHVDEEAARQGPFGQLTASGWHTLSLTMKLVAESRPLGETPLLGVGVDGIEFSRPVYPETEIFARATVLSKRASSKPGRGFVQMEVETIDTASNDVVARQVWTIMVPA